MGYGDEIMATGHAQRVYDESPSRRIAICDTRGRVRWHELWEGNPILAMPQDVARGERVRRISNGAGCRPYIRYPFSASKPCRYSRTWTAREHVGRIYFTEQEREQTESVRSRVGPYVVIEPAAKSNNPNKRWFEDRWRAVVQDCSDMQFVQMAYGQTERMPGVRIERTASFRDACAVLAGSVGYVGTEGGLHHAAAALGIPAVVLFGGFISPRVTGYATHINLADRGPDSPCGMWKPCDHCRAAMGRISVDDVVTGLRSILARSQAREAVAC